MKKFIDSLLSGASDSSSAKRFGGLSIVYTFIICLLGGAVYYICSKNELKLPESIVYSLSTIAVACFAATTIEKIKSNETN